MNSLLQQAAVATLIAAGVLAAPALHADSGKTETVSEQRQVGAFKSIDLSGPYNVAIKAQGQNALSLTGERKQLAEVETFVSGDTLVVRPVRRHGFFFSFGKARDQVTLNITAPGLSSLKISGSGDVDLDQVSGNQLSVTSDGPGDLHGAGAVRELVLYSRGSGDVDLHRLRAERVNLKMSGPGDVTLAGISGELAAEVRGSGDLDADGVRLNKAAAQLHGPGSVRLSGVIKKLDGEVHGSGDLAVDGLDAQQVRLLMNGPGNAELAGSTVVLNAELSGSGDLEADRLTAKNATLRSRGPGGIEISTVSDTLDAELRGSGSMKAAIAGKRLLLKMSGPGDSEIEGSVDQVKAQLSGSGSLEARHLLAGHADVVVRGPGTAVVNVRSKTDAKTDAKTVMAEKSRLVTIDRSGARQALE